MTSRFLCFTAGLVASMLIDQGPGDRRGVACRKPVRKLIPYVKSPSGAQNLFRPFRSRTARNWPEPVVIYKYNPFSHLHEWDISYKAG